MEEASAAEGILFMKVGTHAGESLDDIIARKTKEIEQEGFAMWGYGGNTCHPQTMVQPFAEEMAARGQVIRLCMQPMLSRHFAEPLRASSYSSDGKIWKPIPSGINVLGSRYALIISGLRKDNFSLRLSRTRVAVGPSRGLRGSAYLRRRVDKACLEVHPEAVGSNGPCEEHVDIGLVANIEHPYAVYVK